VESKNKCNTSKITGKWNDVKIIQKLPDQHDEQARNQGIRENSYIAHCANTSESANVKAQNFVAENSAKYAVCVNKEYLQH